MLFFNLNFNTIMFYGSRIVGALLTLIIGLWVINLSVHYIELILQKTLKDATLNSFLKSLIGIFLKIVLFISIIGVMGIQVASFVAVLGAAGLAVGFALQGNLSNLASGVLILFFKPFKVGEVLDFKGNIGKVTEIQVMHTVIQAGDGTKVIIPNSMLSGGNIVVIEN